MPLSLDLVVDFKLAKILKNPYNFKFSCFDVLNSRVSAGDGMVLLRNFISLKTYM